MSDKDAEETEKGLQAINVRTVVPSEADAEEKKDSEEKEESESSQ